MFLLCLFDLDQTLLETDDLEKVREAGKNDNSKEYRDKLIGAIKSKSDRYIYSKETVLEVREKNPDMKIGIFTRSPRSYASLILQEAYPEITWDVIVAYEDVEHTKPHGDGIYKAMDLCGVPRKYLPMVVLVGDGDADIRAAYHAGCVAVLDRSSWVGRKTSDNWRALGHIPDVIIDSPEEIIDVLAGYKPYLPELEMLLYKFNKPAAEPRFDRVNKFIPREFGGDTKAFPIYCCGRSFSGYQSLKWRKNWHKLTKSIHDQKDADIFPDEWVAAVRRFIRTNTLFLVLGGELIVSVVPHRPARKARLEAFLTQLAASFEADPLKGKGRVSFIPDLLAYKAGVRSNSNDRLSPAERFANVRDHLFVNQPDVAKRARMILIIDDVSTTGASLIYAKKYLEEAGAREVKCLSIAMNVSNVIYD